MYQQASELVALLQTAIETYGDLPIWYEQDGELFNGLIVKFASNIHQSWKDMMKVDKFLVLVDEYDEEE